MSSFKVAKSLIHGLVLLLTFVTIALLQNQPIMAQATTGTLKGQIVDPNGQAVPGAIVTAKNQATGVDSPSTVSTGSGLFVVPNLVPGKYTLTVEPTAGFSKSAVTDIDVKLGQDTDITVVLQVGTPSETVTITSSTEEVVQTNSQISNSFETRKVEDLPSNAAGGGIDTLALLAPGVTPGFGNVNSNGTTLSVNGNRARANNFTIDGTDNNDLSIGGPSYFVNNQDLVQEFQIITNNYSAQYGRNQGAIVNIVTKQGTNDVHGSAFLFHRNSSRLDAKTNLERRDSSRGLRDKFISNVYGGTVGGPIVRNKAFFFGSFQAVLQRQSFTARGGNLAILPAEFSRLAAAFPGNAAIQAIINQSAFALTNFGTVRPRSDLPTDTITLGGQTFAAAFPERIFATPYDEEQFSVRGDVNVTPKDNFYIRYLFQNSVSGNGLGGSNGFTGDIPARSQNISGAYYRQFSSRIVNEFRATFQRLDVKFGGGCTDPLTGCIIDPIDIDKAYTNIQFAGILGDATGTSLQTIGGATNLPQGRIVDVYQFADNLSLTFGSHTFTTGVDFRKLKNSVPFLPNINGVFRYNSVTALTTNTPTSVTLADGTATIDYDEFDQFYFFQDDWKIRDNLTLNLGIRYEYTGQPVNLLNELTVARESGSSAFYRQSLPLGVRIVPRISADKNNIAPRFGFAYSPRPEGGFWKRVFGEDATVFRGGYSIAYDPAFYNIMLNISTSAPTVFLDTIAAPIARPPLPTNPTGDRVRSSAASLLRRNTFDPRFLTQTIVGSDFHSPYAQQFSFGVQRQIDNNNVAEVRYVGNRGIGLFQTINRNPLYSNLYNGFTATVPQPGPPGTPTASVTFPNFRNLLSGVPPPQVCVNDPTTPDNEGVCNGRLLAGRGLIRSRENTATSTYHSLQARYNGRFLKNNLTFGASYTFSKALDNASEIFSFGENAVAQNPFNLNSAERSFSGFDRRHAFSLNFLYDLPFYKEQQGFVGHLLGGWQINGTYVLASGRRYTPSQLSIFFGSTYMDATFGQTFIGFDNFRPFIGNINADPTQVGITVGDAIRFGFVDPTTLPLGTAFERLLSLTALNTTGNNVFVTSNDVRLIYNGPFAARLFGNPFGTAARNSLLGPALNQLNFSFFKTTKIRESLKVQFRADLFNTLNHPNPGYGVAGEDSLPSFFIEDAGTFFADKREMNLSSRRVQFGIRIIF
jgi:outer membrane receptor protein involved in Fe transport